MSFSNNIRPDRMPGCLNGNPLVGLCEKVCIEANKVFDACIKQETLSNVTVSLNNIEPSGAVEPFTYISARSLSGQATVSGTVVSGISERGCSRIQTTLAIPIEVVFEDANGNLFSGTATLAVPRDVIMKIPEASVVPYQIVARANAISSEGRYDGICCFIITFCLTTILKVIMTVDLLVPTYGYCFLPPCIEYQEEVCDGFFDLPIFPPS